MKKYVFKSIRKFNSNTLISSFTHLITPFSFSFRQLKSSNDDSGKGSGGSKLLGKKDKKSKQVAVSDIGVVGDDKDGKDGKEHNDSFEKYYNKDLDLDEGKLNISLLIVRTPNQKRIQTRLTFEYRPFAD